MSGEFIDVLVPVPLLEKFTYRLTKNLAKEELTRGVRLKVPFGNRDLIAIFWNFSDKRKLPNKKYKYVKEVLDSRSLLSKKEIELAEWASEYYHYPLGEVITYFFPPSLRKGKEAKFKETVTWKISSKGEFLDLSSMNKAANQKKALQILREEEELSQLHLKVLGISPQTLAALHKKGLLKKNKVERLFLDKKHRSSSEERKLNSEQEMAIKEIKKSFNLNNSFLLNGVTGSGKTEVYLRTIKELIKQGKQALVLIPEIGLAPQTENRFKKIFGETVASFHSAKNEREKLDVWLGAQRGLYKVIIGTRSSIFLPMKNLGIIVVDEEHDVSFKQSDRFRYSARDIALYRGKINKIPVLLASATPSAESIHNVAVGKHNLLKLERRATGADLPSFFPVNLRKKPLTEGFSEELLESIEDELNRKNQVLIFLNRRGYASSLICKSCGWVSNCERCDAHMTVHHNPKILLCHHCDNKKKVISICPSCKNNRFESFGLGTERVEDFLKQKFNKYDVYRIDSDTVRAKNSFKKYLEIINKGKPLILVGTQMLAKGHHFPNVTLVGILDADSGIFSADYRGSERVAQLITQVSGRAGRDKKPGKVILQTYCRDHPQIEELLKGDYESFINKILDERLLANIPPFSHQIKLQAESFNSFLSKDFLNSCIDFINSSSNKSQDLRIVGPLPALMEKKSGLFRWELNFFSQSRSSLHKMVNSLQFFLYEPKKTRRVRWSLDIDPVSTL
tara:strand:+ start:343 stop:2553 length:2211 start_codon:yes stop_codon:yes gene_type:complete